MLQGSPPRVKRHRLSGVPYVPTRHLGGAIEPSLVVVHDTAGPLDPGSSVGWLRANPAKVSAHVVIERDGGITQLAPLNRRANHAGRSHYHGREWCNGFAVGIELVNPGRMGLSTQGGRTWARSWWGALYDPEEHGIVEAETPQHGRGWWMPHTPEQIAAVVQVAIAVADAYPVRDLVPHWYVSPGRKIDTNPLFPLDEVRAVVLGREAAAEGMADEASEVVMGEAAVVVEVPGGEALNLRRWPSFNPNVLAAIPSGVQVPVVRRGEFGGRSWLKVIYGGQEGWIVERYTRGSGA